MAKQEIQIQIPTDWNDITIREYQKYLDIVDSDRTQEQKANEIISLFCGIDKYIINKISVKELNNIVEKVHKFLNKKEPTELKKIVDFKNKKYGFIPNLSKITTGEYIDIEGYCKDTNKNLHKIMSVLYREVRVQKKDLYNIESYNPSEIIKQDFLDFPMGATLSALNFFFYLGMSLTKDFSNFLIVNQMTQKKEVYPQNGAGII